MHIPLDNTVSKIKINETVVSKNIFKEKIMYCIKTITCRKRERDEPKRNFNFKLKNHTNWNDTFAYPFICEIIEVLLPKISVSTF